MMVPLRGFIRKTVIYAAVTSFLIPHSSFLIMIILISDFIFNRSDQSGRENDRAANDDIGHRFPEGEAADDVGSVAADIPLCEESEEDCLDSDPADEPPVTKFYCKVDAPGSHKSQPGQEDHTITRVVDLVTACSQGTEEHPEQDEKGVHDHQRPLFFIPDADR